MTTSPATRTAAAKARQAGPFIGIPTDGAEYAGSPLETAAERQARHNREMERPGRWTWTEQARDATGSAVGHDEILRTSTDETIALIIAKREADRAALCERTAFAEEACRPSPAIWDGADHTAHWGGGGH